MRTIISTFLTLLFVSTLSWSQGLGRVQHPAGSAATLLGSFPVVISIGDDGALGHNSDSRGVLTDGQRKIFSQIIWVWSVSGGTDYTLDPDSLDISGDGSWLDNHSTSSLFDLLSKSAVAQGVALGYTSCSSSCATSNSTVHVYMPSCVARVKNGNSISFVPQDPAALCMREYVVCCPNSLVVPQITTILHEGTVCSGSYNGFPYEAACP